MENSTTQHHSSVKLYLMVFGALGILTGLTVLLSYSSISHGFGIFLAGMIALVKCTLIGAFFMHLRSESKGITALILTALFLVIVLILAIMPDVGFMN